MALNHTKLKLTPRYDEPKSECCLLIASGGVTQRTVKKQLHDTTKRSARVGAERGIWPRGRDGVMERERERDEMNRENDGLSGFGVTSQLQVSLCESVCVLIWHQVTHNGDKCVGEPVWERESVTAWRPIQKWHSTTHAYCTHSGGLCAGTLAQNSQQSISRPLKEIVHPQKLLIVYRLIPSLGSLNN